MTLSRPVSPAEAGQWTIRALHVPDLPATTAAQWPIPEDLATAMLHLTAASLIRTRITTEQRRGSRPNQSANQLANQYEQTANDMIAAHGREARMT